MNSDGRQVTSMESFASLFRSIAVAWGGVMIVSSLRPCYWLGAFMILWVSGSHVIAFYRTERARCLVVAAMTLPAAWILVIIALHRR